MLFAIWNGVSNGVSTATRDFNLPLPVGGTFWVQLEMNNLDAAANTNGFRLEDANGNTLFSYWHQGGDNVNGHYADALTRTGTATGFAYDYTQLDSFRFALTSPTNYTFYNLTTAKSFSGRITSAPISRVTFFRSNGGSTPSNGQDFKFNNLAITITPITPSSFAVAIEKVTQGWDFRFPVAPGYSYRLQSATSITGPWTDLGMLIGPATGIANFIDSNVPASQLFYRTVSP